jgi:hypothetical protein
MTAWPIIARYGNPALWVLLSDGEKAACFETVCGRVFDWLPERTLGSAGKCFCLHEYRRISTFGAGIS